MGGSHPGMFNTGMQQPGNMFGGPMGGPMGGPPMGGPPMGGHMGPGPGQFNTAFNPNTGGGQFNNDPFAGGAGGGPGMFGGASAAPNYNPGGGPAAFGGESHTKKKEKGPKEFNDLFGMASKISDRTNQPQNRVDDYVTSYKNTVEGVGGSMGGAGQVDDMFGGGSASTPMQAPSAQPDFGAAQSSDPFGGINDAFGGDTSQNNMGGAQAPSNDMYGGGAPSNNAFGGVAQPDSSNDMFGGAPAASPAPTSSNEMFGGAPQNNTNDMYGGAPVDNNAGNGMFGGGAPTNSAQPAPAANNPQSNQDELFDIFG